MLIFQLIKWHVCVTHKGSLRYVEQVDKNCREIKHTFVYLVAASARLHLCTDI